MSFFDRLANGLGTLLGVLVDTTVQVISGIKRGYEAYKRQGGATGADIVDEITRKKDRLRSVNDEIMHLRNQRMSSGSLSDRARKRWEDLRAERDQLLSELNQGKEVRAAEKIFETESVIDKVEIDLETTHVLQYNAFADTLGKQCRVCGRPMKLQWKRDLSVVEPKDFYGTSEQLRHFGRESVIGSRVSSMQLSFGDAEDLGGRKRTRREVFLAEMDQVVPWKALLALIEPHYPKMGRPGRQPYPLSTMLRIHFLQQWYALSDPAMEEALYDTPVMRRFAQLGGLADIPDETTILNFRRLLETHGLAEKLFKQVNAHLQRKGLSLRSGTIVDATIISAPSSTKNRSGERDPEMHQAKKGEQWFFGMKAHIGVDDASGLVHHVECTAANVSDVTQAHKLLHGKEDVVIGDSGYTGVEKREEMKGVNAAFLIAEKPSKIRAMKTRREQQQAWSLERLKASVRAKVEHPFRVIKRQFGYTRVRYRGIAKNAAQVLTLFALSNLWMVRRRLLPAAG